MDLITAMETFERCIERGSFSAAARDLRVSQPHVTRCIQYLEARLKANLFRRSTRQLSLTDEGIEYLEHCRGILEAIRGADESVGGGAKELRGELRIFAPVSLGRQWVVPKLGDFMDLHPQLSVKLVLSDRPLDLAEERIDVAIRVGPLRDGAQRVKKLGDVGRPIVAAPRFWDRFGRPEKPADLAKFEWLIFDGPVRVDSVSCVREGSPVETVMVNGRFSSNSSEAIDAALLQGRGACMAPAWLVNPGLARGELEAVLTDWRTVPDLSLFAVYPESRVPTEKIRRCVDWLIFSLQTEFRPAPTSATGLTLQS